MNQEKIKYIKDEILIRTYASACALKNEIRKKIRERRELHWDFCGLTSRGPFILLCFKKCSEEPKFCT